MKDTVKRYLKISGLLCALGAVSALLITATNLLTAPIIEKNNEAKTIAAYQSIYSNVVAVSDPVSVSGSYVTRYWVAYSDQAKSQIIGNIYDGKASYGQTIDMRILVGISGETSNPVLGKISILNNGATGGYDTTVVDKYVTPYNNAPSDTTLGAISCGATAAATTIKMIVGEAKDLYASGGQASTPIATVAASLYGENVMKAITTDTTLSGTYATKYWVAYSAYNSESPTKELGYIFQLKGGVNGAGDITSYVSFSGLYSDPVYGKIYIDSNTFADASSIMSSYVDVYNAAPSKATLDTIPESVKAGATLIQSMVEEAKASYLTLKQAIVAKSNEVFSAFKAAGDPIDLASRNPKYALECWSAYGDEAKSNELGYVFKSTGYVDVEMSEENNYEQAHGSVTMLIGIAEDGSYGKIVTLAVSFTDPNKGFPVYVTTYNSDPATGLDNVKVGATYSASLARDMIKEAASLFTAIKGGN